MSTTNIAGIFVQCYALKKIDITGWCLSNVTNIGNAFGYCYALTSIIGNNTVSSDGSINGSTDYWGKGPKLTFSLTYSELLNHDSLLFLMYWVPTISNN